MKIIKVGIIIPTLVVGIIGCVALAVSLECVKLIFAPFSEP